MANSVIELQIDKDVVVVKLRGQLLKTNHKSTVTLDVHEHNSEEAMRKAVEYAGGTLAEWRGEHFGEHHTPSECATLAVEAWDEAIAKVKEISGSR